MTPINAFAVELLQVTNHPNEILKAEWRADNAAAATGLFLQFHDTLGAPAAGAVPKKSYQLYGGAGSGAGAYDYKEFKPGEGEAEFSTAVWVGVSSTEATYTAAGGTTDLAMLSIEIRRLDNALTSTFVGDYTTAVNSLQIWSVATGAASKKKLMGLEIDATSLNAADKWLMIFATDSPATGATPFMVLSITPAQKYLGPNAKRFGLRGLDNINQIVAGVTTYGCTVAISRTAITYTAALGTCTIKGEFAINP